MIGKFRPTNCIYCMDREDKFPVNWCCYKDRANIVEINDKNCPCSDKIEEFEIFEDEEIKEQTLF